MKILLASESLSKKSAVEIALEKLGIESYEITCVKVNSDVSVKPLDNEILLGAKNRINNLLEYAKSHDIDFDYIISIEGGYECIESKHCFVKSYCCVLDKNEEIFIGSTPSLQISKNMFEWSRRGLSLNEVISSFLDKSDSRHGLSSFLSNGYYQRDVFESSGVISAMQSAFNYKNNYCVLEDYISERLSLLEQEI